MSGEPGLKLQGVSKRHGAAFALRDVSLEVRDGELLVLVGPSGSGKSTLLRLVAGLLPLDGGEVFIQGRPVSRVPAAERDVAMVFQSYALFPHLTVEENLGFGLEARGTKEAEARRRITEVAETLGLAPMLKRLPRQLSGGERQRVALGRAMVRQPKLFLMDEPLSNLDAQLRGHTRAEIIRLQARLGTTTVYVTHDQVEALGMGHRVGVLRDGVLQQLGTPREVYDAPANLFVARFLGTPAMNALPVTAEPPGTVRWGELRLEVPEALRVHLGAPGAARVLGVRPEHVHVQGSRWSEGAPPGPTFAATVDVVENAGEQVLLTLEAQGTRLSARVHPGFFPQRGDTVRVWFETARLHLFDAATERALGRAGA
jgi:multiple sugar transport system ATP-binding protein